MSSLASRASPTQVRRIDEDRLDQDVSYRVGYLAEFMGLTQADWDAIRESRRT